MLKYPFVNLFCLKPKQSLSIGLRQGLNLGCSLGLALSLWSISAAVLAAQTSTAPMLQQSNQYVIKQLNIQSLPVKTIVPITAKTAAQAIEQAQVIAANPDADLAEFRIDLLDFASDTQAVIALGQKLNQILKDKPMIATIRTANEGGQMQISDQDYARVYSEYLKQPFMQLLDIEMFRQADAVKALVAQAHQQQVLVVMSNHDFHNTPNQAEIEKRLMQQADLGADVLKIAVMPNSRQDVMTLMNATLAVSQKTSKPLLTMSMGQLGVISRIATASMGGSMSFGMIGQASAPGQIDVGDLKQLLKTVQPPTTAP